MTWVISMHVTECAGGAPIVGAFVTDGAYTHYTNPYGDFTAVIYDDSPAFAVNVGKGGYVTRYTVLYQNQAGSTVQVCLDHAPPPTGGGGTTGCFIVSATTGSADSAENMRLNMLRDRVMRTTGIGAALLDSIYADYYSFSPPIADELGDDPALRDQVLQVGVRPLLAWYRLVETLALDADLDATAADAARAVVDACVIDGPATPALAADMLAAIVRGEPIPADAPAPFGYLSSRLRDAIGLPFSNWAIFQPLGMAWQCAAGRAEVLEQAALWLAAAPLEQIAPPEPDDRLDCELAQLASGPFAAAPLRQEVGGRLLSVWPHLRDALLKHGFVAHEA